MKTTSKEHARERWVDPVKRSGSLPLFEGNPTTPFRKEKLVLLKKALCTLGTIAPFCRNILFVIGGIVVGWHPLLKNIF